jgi:hypothetical protein
MSVALQGAVEPCGGEAALVDRGRSCRRASRLSVELVPLAAHRRSLEFNPCDKAQDRGWRLSGPERAVERA